MSVLAAAMCQQWRDIQNEAVVHGGGSSAAAVESCFSVFFLFFIRLVGAGHPSPFSKNPFPEAVEGMTRPWKCIFQEWVTYKFLQITNFSCEK